MEIWPLPSATGSRLREVLSEIRGSAANLSGAGHNADELIPHYLKWAVDAGRLARGVLSTTDLERLVLTRRYWAIDANGGQSPVTAHSLSEEIQARVADLEAAIASLDVRLGSWSSGARASIPVVVDTNVWMNPKFTSATADWHTQLGEQIGRMDDLVLVVPSIVVDELDNLKRDHKARTQARLALKYLYDLLAPTVELSAPLRPSADGVGDVILRWLPDPRPHMRLSIADDELVDRAVTLSAFLGREVHFVTYDTNAAFRAHAVDLRVHRLAH